jgi:trehalose-6-phosphate synthase
MPRGERSRRATELRARVRAHTPSDWIENQLEDLVRVQKGAEPATSSC